LGHKIDFITSGFDTLLYPIHPNDEISNGINCKKRKLNNLQLNSEIESYFDPRKERTEDSKTKILESGKFM
jgi:hypothetical protein